MSKSDIDSIMATLKKSKKVFDITRLSDDESPCVVHEWLSTGCVALDAIIGGGLPLGRITEIYGDTSTGKSLIAAQVTALAQQDDVTCVYIDTEAAVSIQIMKMVGVDVDNLLYSAPDTIEDAFELMEAAVKAKSPDKKMLIVWDSVAATATKMEMENEYGKATMGKGAQVISQSLRKFTRIIAREQVCALFLNQVREKIGVMFGDNVATFGGKAIPFHSSVRIQLKYAGKIKNGKKVIGIETKAYVSKNKVSMPFLTCQLPIYFNVGIDDALASFYYLKDAELLTGSGSYYTIEGLNADKFTKANWDKVYEKHYGEIADMIMNTEISGDGEDESEGGAE